MDGQRFDWLAVQLGRALSRRRFGTMVAALGLRIGLGSDEAAEAKRKKKKGKKKKKGNGNPTPTPTCSGAPPCASGCRDCGTVCIPDNDVACCTQDDCGGFNFTDLACVNNRCICNPNGKAGWGICERFGNGSGLCGPCCPGATVAKPCFGENVCVNQTIQGCGCEPPKVGCPGKDLCSLDLLRDSTRCGNSCQDCTASGLSCCPNAAGTNGFCVNLRGCAPNTGNSECLFGDCGECGSRCDLGFICCDRGGPTGECVPAVGGQFCPPLP